MADKSMEELMNVDVTSVSRKDQKLTKTPAAVYVITQEAIERSGATIIPDLLRMVPGVQVAQVEANRWAISVRGFNDIYSNKVLVLIDGRTVYTPTFSGVYWDQIDIPLNTIERIEVVRGPGGTVWGANAVNGVISIITKKSNETEGALVSAGSGSEQTADYLAQYGGKVGSAFSYRAFGHYASFGDLPTAQGSNGHDGWLMRHAGFRTDWNRSAKNTFMAEGNFFQTNGSQTTIDPLGAFIGGRTLKLTNSAADILFLWTHKHSERFDSALQIYDSSYLRYDAGLREKTNVLDFDYKSHLLLGSRNDIVWGAGYRLTTDRLGSQDNRVNTLSTLGFSVSFAPPSKNYGLFNTFFQDEIRLAENLSLTVGSKLEHNAFTGFEYEPSARFAWTPKDNQTLWLSASRAVRQPSRFDTALNIDFPLIPLGHGLFLNQKTLGNPYLNAETVKDYELGYRISPTKRILFDFTGFYSFYNDLESSALAAPIISPSPQGLIITNRLVNGNRLTAQDYGVEATANWNVNSRWKLSGNYSFLKMNLYSSAADAGLLAAAFQSSVFNQALGMPLVQGILLGVLNKFTNGDNVVQRTSPRNQFNLQSYVDLTPRLSFDTSLYFVGELPAPSIHAYARLDSKIGWKFDKHITVALVGQNLLDPHHLEFGSAFQAVATEVPRSVFGKVVWTF